MRNGYTYQAAIIQYIVVLNSARKSFVRPKGGPDRE